MKWYQIENSDGSYLVQMESGNPIIRFCVDSTECAQAFTNKVDAVNFIKENVQLAGCKAVMYQG